MYKVKWKVLWVCIYCGMFFICIVFCFILIGGCWLLLFEIEKDVLCCVIVIVGFLFDCYGVVIWGVV